ncbi:MAG: hypothetical protein KDB61_02080, partial [Planctomycetes bacterium]|nr:hypothetical protein [Planctomycetota bacterium]
MRKSFLFSAAASILLASTAVAQNGTDDCTAPTAIGEGTFAFDTTAMVTQDDLTGCNSNLFAAGGLFFYNDMYYVYTATAAGTLTVDTEGSSFDTQIAVHSGIDCAAVCIDNDDDDGTGLLSSLTIPGVNIGDQFVIQVGGYGTASGAGLLNVTVSTPITNDDCSIATPLTGTGAFAWDNTGATTTGFVGGTGTYVSIKSDVFYQWTAPAAGDYKFDTFGTTFDTKLAVHAGAGCAATFIDYNDDTGGLQSEVSASGLLAGDQILIQVGSFGTGTQGAGTLNIYSWVDPCTSAVDDGLEDNDDCTTPVALAAGIYTNLFASNGDADYYAITVPAGDDLDVTTTDLTGDLDYALYDNTCTYIQGIFGTGTWNNNTGAAATVVLEVINSPFSADNCGTYDLDILISTPPPAPANDLCSTPDTVTMTGTGTFNWDNTSATESGFVGTGTYITIKSDLFYVWSAPVAGDYIFDTYGTTFDTKLAVHAGFDCAATFIAYNDDTGGLQSEVAASGLLAGDQILIQVGSYSTVTQGAGILNITQFIDPCIGAVDDGLEDNDACATPYTMAMGYYPNLFVSDTDADYYSITIPAGDIMTVNATLLTGDVDFNLYDNTCAFVQAMFPLGGGDTYSNTTGVAQTVVLEVLNYNAGTSTCATYDLDVSSAPDPCQGSDDSLEDNDDCSTATPVGDGTIAGLFVSKTDKDHYATCVADGATITVDILFIDANGDLDLFLWDASDVNCGTGFGTTELAYGFSVSDNESLSWTNSTGSDLNVVIEVNTYTGSATDCNNYDLVVAGSGCGPVAVGTPFCDPANANSTGFPAVLTANWGTGIGSDLHLGMSGGVPGQLAYMLVGNEATGGFTVPGANGPLCLVGTPTAVFYRYNVNGSPMNSIGGFDPNGDWINAVGTATST